MPRPYNISFKTTDIPKTSISKVTIKKSGMTARWAAKKVTTTINKLKAGKKYFVRIRTYKTFDKKNYYSTWSKVKEITIKK